MRNRIRWSGAALAACVAGQLHAQAAPSPLAGPPTADAPRPTTETGTPEVDQPGIQDIVVTAQRRSERLQSVPVTVVALNAKALQTAGIAQTSDLQILTPGLVWSTGVGVPTPFIRGVGSRDSSAANENGVATYLDGIYYAAMPAGLLSLPNIERIEVLKGPQGTLFGRNANGGLIQIITRDPPSRLTGDLKLSYANYDTVTGSAYVGAPLTDTLSADMSIYYTNQRNGWGHNLLSGADVNLTKDFTTRVKLLFKPTADTRFVLTGDYDRRRSDVGNASTIVPGATAADGKCGGTFPARYPACAPQPSSTARGSIYDSQSDLYGYSGKNGAQAAGVRQGGVSFVAEHEADFATLRSLSSYRRFHSNVYVDQEGSALPISEVTWQTIDRTFTQELQIASPRSSPINWVFGGFYMHRLAGYDPFHVFGYSVGQASALDPAGRYGAPPAFGGSFDVFARVKTNSYAGYGQATAAIVTDTNLTLGVRYTSDVDKLNARQIDARGVVRAAANVGKTFSKLTYRASLDHHFTPTVMVYGSYNRGFKAGLFSTTGATGTYANPETLDAFELGAKTDLLDRHLRLNVSAFHYNYKGLQLPIVIPGGTQTINAARARINGIDAEITALPLTGLTLSAGGSFLIDAKYQSFPNGPLLVPNGVGNTQLAADLSGNRLIRAPKLTGNAAINYSVPTDSGNFGFHVGVYHNSGFFWTPDDQFAQKSYDLVNSQVSWTSPNRHYTVQLWAKNLTKQKYFTYYSPTGVGTVGAPGDPRTYGLTGEFSF